MALAPGVGVGVGVGGSGAIMAPRIDQLTFVKVDPFHNQNGMNGVGVGVGFGGSTSSSSSSIVIEEVNDTGHAHDELTSDVDLDEYRQQKIKKTIAKKTAARGGPGTATTTTTTPIAPPAVANKAVGGLSPASSSSGSPSSRKQNCCTFTGCTKSFAKPSALKRHLRTHTGERPFQCPHPSCNLSFAEKGNLKRHSRVHTGEKPYQCTVPGCGQRFARMSHVTQHTRTQHPELKQKQHTRLNNIRNELQEDESESDEDDDDEDDDDEIATKSSSRPTSATPSPRNAKAAAAANKAAAAKNLNVTSPRGGGSASTSPNPSPRSAGRGTSPRHLQQQVPVVHPEIAHFQPPPYINHVPIAPAPAPGFPRPSPFASFPRPKLVGFNPPNLSNQRTPSPPPPMGSPPIMDSPGLGDCDDSNDPDPFTDVYNATTNELLMLSVEAGSGTVSPTNETSNPNASFSSSDAILNTAGNNHHNRKPNTKPNSGLSSSLAAPFNASQFIQAFTASLNQAEPNSSVDLTAAASSLAFSSSLTPPSVSELQQTVSASSPSDQLTLREASPVANESILITPPTNAAAPILGRSGLGSALFGSWTPSPSPPAQSPLLATSGGGFPVGGNAGQHSLMFPAPVILATGSTAGAVGSQGGGSSSLGMGISLGSLGSLGGGGGNGSVGLARVSSQTQLGVPTDGAPQGPGLNPGGPSGSGSGQFSFSPMTYSPVMDSLLDVSAGAPGQPNGVPPANRGQAIRGFMNFSPETQQSWLNT